MLEECSADYVKVLCWIFSFFLFLFLFLSFVSTLTLQLLDYSLPVQKNI